MAYEQTPLSEFQNGPKTLPLGELGKKPRDRKPARQKRQKGNYTVKAGDNPSAIARALYGDERYFNVVLQAAGGMLQPGMVLDLPDLSDYQADLAARGEKHFVSQGEVDYARALTGYKPARQAQTQTQVTLTDPPIGSSVSSMGPNSYANLAAPPTNASTQAPASYSDLAAQNPYRPGMANPGTRTVRPPKPPKTPASSGRPSVPPPLQMPNAAQPGAAEGYYTGVGMPSYYNPSGPYDPYNPAYLERPPSQNAAGNVAVPPTGNQQIIPQRGMTGAQTAAALESGLLPKPAGTYQVQGTVQRPIYSATEVDVYGKPKIVGWETVPTGQINVSATGYKPAAYLGFTSPYLGSKPGGQRVIGGGEGYPDYIPAGPPRPPGAPLPYAGSGGGGGFAGGGGGRRGGGGGGGPTGGGGRGAPMRQQVSPTFAQASTLPGGRAAARNIAGLSRTGLVTWRL